MSAPIHVLVTGGGSAGHVTPALAVADELLARGARVTFVGSRSGLEEALVAGRNISYHGISGGKLRRYFSLQNLLDVGRVLAGIWQAFWLLGRLRPSVVFSKGGFVAFPVVFAAWLRRVPVLAHESDFSPGLANRLSQPFMQVLCLSFEETDVAEFSGTVLHTGAPVRAELLNGNADAGRVRLGFANTLPVLLVTGGSLGADDLNRAVIEALPELVADWQVVHVHGAGRDSGEPQTGYVALEYVDEGWGDVLAAADLVVSRAGSNALFELLALRKLHVLVPLPRAASRGDQIENAAFARDQGFSDVLRNEDLSGEAILEAVRRAWRTRDARAEALARFETPPAATGICEALLALAKPNS